MYPFKNYELCCFKGHSTGKYLVASDSGMLRCDCDVTTTLNSRFRVIFTSSFVSLKNEAKGYVFYDSNASTLRSDGMAPGMLFTVLQDASSPNSCAFVAEGGFYLRQTPNNSIEFSAEAPDDWCLFTIIREFNMVTGNVTNAFANFFSDLGRGIDKCLSDERPTGSPAVQGLIASGQEPKRMKADITVIRGKLSTRMTKADTYSYVRSVVNTTTLTCSDISEIMRILNYPEIRASENYAMVIASLKDEEEKSTWKKHPAVAPYCRV